MHNLKSLYDNKTNEKLHVPLHPKILEKQLSVLKFQQLLYERRLKTDSFEKLLRELRLRNEELVIKLKNEIDRFK